MSNGPLVQSWHRVDLPNTHCWNGRISSAKRLNSVPNSFDSSRCTPDIRPPLHTGNFIDIRARREDIFSVVSDLPRWPELLPHYRSIRMLGAGEKGRIVRMAAFRSGIPISWVSEFWTDANALELHFLHLRNVQRLPDGGG